MYYNNYVNFREDISDLYYKEWSFYFMEGILYLDSYGEFSRESKRRKIWAKVKWYHRLHKRDSNLLAEDVELPDYVKYAAYNQFIQTISVKKWEK